MRLLLEFSPLEELGAGASGAWRESIMQSRCSHLFFWTLFLAGTFFGAPPARAQIWKQFVPSSRGTEPQAAHETVGSSADRERATGESRRLASDDSTGDY